MHSVCTLSMSLSTSANLENSAVVTGLEKSLFISILKKGNAKECSNYGTIVLISHMSKVMLKILQARLQQYLNQELPDVHVGCRKGRATRYYTTNICWILVFLWQFQKNTYFCFLTMWKPLTVWITKKNMENSSRDGNTRPPYLPPEKPVCRSRCNS